MRLIEIGWCFYLRTNLKILKSFTIGMIFIIALSAVSGCGTQGNTSQIPTTSSSSNATTASAKDINSFLKEYQSKVAGKDANSLVDHMKISLNGKVIEAKLYMKKPEGSTEQFTVGYTGLMLLGGMEDAIKKTFPNDGYKTQFGIYVGNELNIRKQAGKDVYETKDDKGNWVEMK
jgi:hypothetical protein